jgi:hypothetical protein
MRCNAGSREAGMAATGTGVVIWPSKAAADVSIRWLTDRP